MNNLPGESQGQGSLVAAVYGVTKYQTWLKWLSRSSSSSKHIKGQTKFFKVCWLSTVWAGTALGFYWENQRTVLRKKIIVMSLSYVRPAVTPWTVAHQAPLSTGFLKQEYWSGLPLPSPGDLPYPGTEPRSPALAGRFFTTEPQRRPKKENATSLKV